MDLLWTDQCFLFMLAVMLLAFINAMRRETSRRRFKSLFSKPMALCSGVVLLFFLGIATIDSIHFSAEGGSRSVSILDRLMAPLDQFYEKSYSSPMALTLSGRESVIVNGQLKQIYPRLQYPPAWIASDKDRQKLVTSIVLDASITSLLVLMGMLAAITALLRTITIPRSIWQGSITFCVCLFFLLASWRLSRYFHVFGTGKIGQDIFYYTIKSIRTGIIIGTLTTLFMLPLALILGIAAGYFGGFVDDVIQYLYTTLSSIPGVLLITASVLSMQTFIANHPEQFSSLDKSADARLLALCLILGVTSWTSLCRLLRAETLKLREIDFVMAARAQACSAWYIIRRHLLPNVMSIVLITLVLDFSFLVLAEAVLSYVGVGVSPMTISWGNMINGARLELAREPLVWWPIAAAFVFMFVLVLASNLFADTVRDVFDPHRGG
ncbi:ABC transporter permease [Legionella sp. CNM-4043-24]|uniref:ABC transporter permease n=1 Tax=Legionella sp. CNM-4043-24 TaxID=3421646 RepID=UPI00403AA2FB